MERTLKKYFPVFVAPTLIAFAFAFIVFVISNIFINLSNALAREVRPVVGFTSVSE